MNKNVQIKESGILCDNPNCDWKDETVKHVDLKDWLNALCPKCGENVLTQEDYDNVAMFYEAMAMVNTMSQEDISALNESADRASLIKSDLFKDASGLDNLTNTDKHAMLNLKISTHKGIKVTDIEKL